MPSKPKTCQQCGHEFSKPERHFRRIGVGYRPRCIACEEAGAPATGEAAAQLLIQIRDLLTSPTCGRCGAKGAKKGTSMAGTQYWLCEECDP